MLAQFSIWTLDDPNLRSEMQTVREILDRREISYEMGRMATTLEGDLPDILAAVQACQQKLSEKHSRLLMNLTIDDDRAE